MALKFFEGVQSNRDLVSIAVQHNGLALQYAKEFSTDKEIVLQAVQQNGDALEFASEELRSDYLLARAAIAKSPRAIAYVSAALRQEKELFSELALEALIRDGMVLELLPEFANSPTHLLTALANNGAALAYATDAQNDRHAVFIAVKSNGLALAYASEALRSDPEIYAAAVTNDPAAIFVANTAQDPDRFSALALIAARRVGADSEGFRAKTLLTFLEGRLELSTELASILVRRDRDAYSLLPAHLQTTPEVILEALRWDKGALFKGLPPTLQQNLIFIKHALRVNRAVAQWLDPQWYEEAAHIDPLILDLIPPENAADLLTSDPIIRRKYTALHRGLKRYGIEHSEYFPGIDTLREILRNREADDPGDNRPLALVFFGRESGTAGKTNRLDELSKHYRVLYYEVETDKQLLTNFKVATQHRKADLLLIAGHGEPRSIALGAQQMGRYTHNEEKYLDLSDLPQLTDGGFGDRLAPGAMVILKSCSTGKGKYGATNIANTIAQAAPQAVVYAPTLDTNNLLRFNAEGRISDPGFFLPNQQVHVVGAAHPGPTTPITDYPRYAEIVAQMAALERQYPAWVRRVKLGTTYEGPKSGHCAWAPHHKMEKAQSLAWCSRAHTMAGNGPRLWSPLLWHKSCCPVST